MIYDKYIVKKTDTINGLTGFYHIKKGQIYERSGNLIVKSKNEFFCLINSENCKKFFWGYNERNPEKEIERQKKYEFLFEKAPSSYPVTDFWKKYGEFIEVMPNTFYWNWYDFVSDLSIEQLEYLIFQIKVENPSPKIVGRKEGFNLW